jgi:Fe-S-cluster containining protein
MFPCTQCGLCCQNISQIKELKDYDLGNGICKYFDYINNSCKIYENRPNICQIDKMFDIKYHKIFTKKEFYIANAKVCNYLQETANINLSYRIKLEE